MRVLVSGANGFLGSNIIRELNSRNIQVRAFMRESCDLRGLSDHCFEPYYGDVLDLGTVIKAAQGCDYVIHAAAMTGPVPTSYSFYHDVNVLGTQNIIQAVKANGLKRMVFVSSANTVGYGSKEFPGEETNPISPLFSKSGYALSKLKAEEIIQKEVETGQLEAIILNPSFMIGSYDAKPSSGMLLLNIVDRPIALLPEGGKSFIHVKNVAQACCEAFSKGKSGEKYLLANENLSYSEFFSIVNNISGEKQSLRIIPKWLMGVIGQSCSIMNLFGANAKLTALNARLISIDNYYSGLKAADTFGLSLLPITLAVEEALDWYIKNEYLKPPFPAYSV